MNTTSFTGDSADHQPARLLVVSPDDNTLQGPESILDAGRWTVLRAFNLAVARLCAASADPDVILVESRLPDGTWLDLFEFVNTQDHAPPLVVMSSAADERLWAEVMNRGGFDVLPRPLVPAETSRVLALALHSGRGRLGRRNSTAGAGGC